MKKLIFIIFLFVSKNSISKISNCGSSDLFLENVIISEIKNSSKYKNKFFVALKTDCYTKNQSLKIFNSEKKMAANARVINIWKGELKHITDLRKNPDLNKYYQYAQSLGLDYVLDAPYLEKLIKYKANISNFIIYELDIKFISSYFQNYNQFTSESVGLDLIKVDYQKYIQLLNEKKVFKISISQAINKTWQVPGTEVFYPFYDINSIKLGSLADIINLIKRLEVELINKKINFKDPKLNDFLVSATIEEYPYAYNLFLALRSVLEKKINFYFFEQSRLQWFVTDIETKISLPQSRCEIISASDVFNGKIKNLNIIDVRSDSDYKQFFIENSINMPLVKFKISDIIKAVEENKFLARLYNLEDFRKKNPNSKKLFMKFSEMKYPNSQEHLFIGKNKFDNRILKAVKLFKKINRRKCFVLEDGIATWKAFKEWR